MTKVLHVSIVSRLVFFKINRKNYKFIPTELKVSTYFGGIVLSRVAEFNTSRLYTYQNTVYDPLHSIVLTLKIK